MMWIAVLYVALMAYAAGLFIYAVTHDRPWAAIGILLSATGFQFAAFGTIAPDVSIAIALLGLVLVGRDVVTSMFPRLSVSMHRSRAR